MKDEHKDEKTTTSLVHRVVTIIAVVLIIANVYIIYGLYTNMNLLNNMLDLRTEMVDNIGEFGELQAMAGEIKAIYDEYGIVEDIDFDKCSDLALKAIALGTGDVYSGYFSSEESDERNNERTEEQFGIGVKIVYEQDNGCYVTNVFANSGAEAAGIKKGDYLIKADGISVIDKGYETFVDAIAGEEGTEVNITYIRDGVESTIPVTRGDFTSSSVTFDDIDGIAYIKIDSFTYKTNSEFTEIMDSLKTSGYEDYIIDLRNNLGGSLETVVDMVDYMVPSGLIFRSEWKDPSANMEYYSGPDEFTGNLVILTNNSTASASEMFTQSLIDFDKATVIGDKTFGKGTVVTEYNLSNGGTLVVSTARYYTHSGTCVEGVGITPDIEVSLDEEASKIYYKLSYEEDTQLQAGINFFKSV